MKSPLPVKLSPGIYPGIAALLEKEGARKGKASCPQSRILEVVLVGCCRCAAPEGTRPQRLKGS